MDELNELRVASFNMHAGVDGWGRPFDFIEAARQLDAEVLVLQEAWTPRTGIGQAEAIGNALGYSVISHPLASGRLAGPDPLANDRWMRPMNWRSEKNALYLDSEHALSRRGSESDRFHSGEPGSWGIAVLSRIRVLSHELFLLPKLKRDRSRRAAIVVATEFGGNELIVLGTHMSHLGYGSPRHYIQLRQFLKTLSGQNAVLLGDMNLWGPPVKVFLSDWKRAVRGRTWPAWRPHSQVDHILTRGSLRVVKGEVMEALGSDHRPIRATLSFT